MNMASNQKRFFCNLVNFVIYSWNRYPGKKAYITEKESPFLWHSQFTDQLSFTKKKSIRPIFLSSKFKHHWGNPSTNGVDWWRHTKHKLRDHNKALRRAPSSLRLNFLPWWIELLLIKVYGLIFWKILLFSSQI